MRALELGHPARFRLFETGDGGSGYRAAGIQYELPQLSSPHERVPAVFAKQERTVGAYIVSPPSTPTTCAM